MIRKFVFRRNEDKNGVNVICFSAEFINYLFPM